MHVKIFEADSVKEAMEQVKNTLGPDALILSTRTIPNSKLGILGKARHEVTAAIDGTEEPAPLYPSPASQKAKAVKRHAGEGAVPRDIRAVEEAFERQQEFLTGQLQALKKEFEHHETDSLKNELDELKNMMRSMLQKTRQPVQSRQIPTTNGAHGPTIWPAPFAMNAQLRTKKYQPKSMSAITVDMLTPLLQTMKKNDISMQLAKRFVFLAQQEMTLSRASLPDEQKRFLTQKLSRFLTTTGSLVTPGEGAKRIALVGPAGVGKTTTLAKMAALFLKNGGKRAALISIDTYCIGATEQMKLYGRIMKLPVEVVSTPDQLAVALARHRDKERIFIDMAGRSPKDTEHLHELSTFFPPEFSIETHLVLSAATAEKYMRQIIKKFSFLKSKSHIFTKLDECDTIGTVVNINLETKQPISYVTDGQRVPEDIHLATKNYLAELATNR